MAVIIRNMEMPTCCKDCALICYDSDVPRYEWTYCPVIRRVICETDIANATIIEAMGDYIHPDCPLVNYDEKPARYKTVKEFADEWGVEPNTIRVWIKRKKLQALRIGSCNYILEGTPKPGRKQRERKE